MVKNTSTFERAPSKRSWLETGDVANPRDILLIVSIFSYRATSHGGMKPNFIQYEKRIFKKPPSLKENT
jgi:hypothetical protein